MLSHSIGDAEGGRLGNLLRFLLRLSLAGTEFVLLPRNFVRVCLHPRHELAGDHRRYRDPLERRRQPANARAREEESHRRRPVRQETYRRPDGAVDVPEVLRPYLRGATVIGS